MSMVAERDRFVAFAFAAADVLIEADNDGRVVYATGALGAFLQGPANSAVGQPLEQLIAETDRPLVRLLLDEIRDGGRRGPIVVTGAPGNAAAECSMLRTPGGRNVHLVLRGTGQPPPPKGVDPVTGLLDAEAFADYAEREFLRLMEAAPDVELSLIRIVGLDTVPGGIGGAGVQGVVQGLAAALRAVSISGTAAARLGDDRFAVVHSGRIDAQRLDGLVARSLEAEGLEGVSVERADVPMRNEALSASQACAALRHALKRFEIDGETRFDDLADALSQRLSATAARVADAKLVIDSQDFFVVYQPIVGLDDDQVHHSEALARLTAGEPSIFDFVTFAEEIGFILDFDLAIAREVFKKLGSLKCRQIKPHVAINLSARSIASDQFVDRLLTLCRGAGTLARQVMFEITESFQIVDLARANQVIQRLRAAGHSACLDDFGAGAAAFHYIQALDVDYVKLDGLFVKRVVEGERDAAVLRGMVDLCRSLDVRTIAEMVETPAHAQELKRLGVNYAQGFLYGRPEANPAMRPTASSGV